MLAVLTFATSGLVANGVKPGASALRASSPVMSGQSGQQIGIPDKCARRRLPPPPLHHDAEHYSVEAARGSDA